MRIFAGDTASPLPGATSTAAPPDGQLAASEVLTASEEETAVPVEVYPLYLPLSFSDIMMG